MPYLIRRKKRKGRVLYLIVRKRDGKVVGKSTSARKAHISAWYRMQGHKR